MAVPRNPRGGVYRTREPVSAAVPVAGGVTAYDAGAAAAAVMHDGCRVSHSFESLDLTDAPTTSPDSGTSTARPGGVATVRGAATTPGTTTVTGAETLFASFDSSYRLSGSAIPTRRYVPGVTPVTSTHWSQICEAYRSPQPGLMPILRKPA